MTDKKYTRTVCILFCILTVLHTLFVFSNSLQTAEVSGAQSGVLVDYIVEKLSALGLAVPSEDFEALITTIVRKTAHFAEFALLAVYFYISLFTAGKKIPTCLISTVIFCFVVGCADEALQMCSFGRSCQFSDAILDTAGGLFGAAVTSAAVIFISKRISRGKR